MKILQITLLLLFVSFNSFAQLKTDPQRKSLLSNKYVREAESNLLTLIYKYDSDTTLIFKNIRENALRATQNDTLLLFSSGSMGYNSSEGGGDYDSITLKYSFLYEDIYTDCETSQDFEIGTKIYNSIIKDEIAKRYSKNWQTEIKETKNRENTRTGRRIHFEILVNDKVVDTLYIDKIEGLRINVVNQKKVTEYIKRDILATVSFAKGRKLVSQYENVSLEKIAAIIENELKIKSLDEIDRVVIDFSNVHYWLGVFVYPIK